MKKLIILLACVLAAGAAGAQKNGFTLSLREDLVDFSTMSVGDNEMNPYGTAYRHTFGTELSVGYHYCPTGGWEFGISAGLMLHNYSQTGIFNIWEKPTYTSQDGLFTVTEWQTYDRQTTLNLPLVLNVKYLFADWAEAQLWDVVPLVSTRLGYVMALTRIKGEYFCETVVNNVPNPQGLTPGTDREWSTTRFDRQGWFLAFGVGLRYSHLDFELEYTFQPRHLVTDRHYERLDGAGVPTTASAPTHLDTHFDNSDGLTLRISYSF